MLNQDDFRKILSTPNPNASGDGGKIRFDLKQVAKFDRDNKRDGNISFSRVYTHEHVSFMLNYKSEVTSAVELAPCTRKSLNCKSFIQKLVLSKKQNHLLHNL